MKCNCQDWSENIEKVNGPIILQAIRSGMPAYDGKSFSHCPWCGTSLAEKLPPHRRFEIVVKCGGDTHHDAVMLLEEFAQDISEGKTGCAHGGPSAGGHFDVKEHPEMTHDNYASALSEYLKP